MIEFSRFNQHGLAIVMLMICFLFQKLNLSWSLNEEGVALLKFKEGVVSDPFGALSNWNNDIGVDDHCSWYGVGCSNGKVVILNLKNLGLEGTIAPDLHNLVHLKSIILRNNSFSGIIPEEIGEIKELEVLDLGYNNFSGPPPSDYGNKLSLTIILLDNNELFGSMLPEFDELKVLSKVQVDENQLFNAGQISSSGEILTSVNTADAGNFIQRRLLNIDVDSSPKRRYSLRRQITSVVSSKTSTSSSSLPPSSSPSPSPSASPSLSPSPSPSPSPSASSPSPSPSASSPSPSPSALQNPKLNSPSLSDSPPSLLSPVNAPSADNSESNKSSSSKRHVVITLSAVIGGAALLSLLAIGIYFCRNNKVSSVKPWATGLSGQLQKAFVTGVPNLKKTELDTACEDFSNVIGSSSMGTVYKGTLSSGVEIAVTSLAVESSKEWPENLELQFRKKIEQLSRVNHKNFVNLIGYCEEENPFTRMMVFEYAPNGTLFEHLHIREAEHLDWVMRMRIAMGIAYCLEHLHQLKPPVAHKNLNSSAVNLTEDYAAKMSDFGLWNEFASTEMQANPESNVYSFGVILFEMITGRLPYMVESSALQDWASDYLKGEQPLREIVDPILTAFNSEQLDRIGEVIKSCCHFNPKQRPAMRDVAAKLKEITRISADEAVPRLSPLWWAELEIISSEGL